MRIVTLVENSSCREELGCEHGLSLYIETGEHRILFDMGQSGLFLQNAAQMGIDLAKVDLAVLSHGHYDHGGGLAAFLEVNHRAPVYVQRTAFDRHLNGKGGDIGLNPKWKDHPRMILTEDNHTLVPGITLQTCNRRPLAYPIQPFGQQMAEGNGFFSEDYRHEQYLLVEEDGKRICISGCSHKGIQNIVHWFRPDILVGGFHLMKLENREELEKIADNLAKSPTVYYTGHCTGQNQFRVMQLILGDRLREISTGTMLEL